MVTTFVIFPLLKIPITFLNYLWILTCQASRIIAILLPPSRSCICSAPSPPRYDQRSACAVQEPFLRTRILYWVSPPPLSGHNWAVKWNMWFLKYYLFIPHKPTVWAHIIPPAILVLEPVSQQSVAGSHTAQHLACKRVCYMGLKLKPALGLWYNLHCALTWQP